MYENKLAFHIRTPSCLRVSGAFGRNRRSIASISSTTDYVKQLAIDMDIVVTWSNTSNMDVALYCKDMTLYGENMALFVVVYTHSCSARNRHNEIHV